MESEEQKILEERKAKVMSFLRQKKEWIYYIGLAVIIWFSGIFIRTANISRLKDVTTGGWTLAPDLDPFLFLRWAKYIAQHGSLMALDTLRYAPLGFKTAGEMPFVPYGIAYLYKLLHIFSDKVTVEYAAIIFPVIFFCLTMIVFFIFVKELFIKYKNPNLIALIATAFLAVIPGFLHRTIAGVPEKESAGFLFMFLAFYFIIKAWREDKWKKSAVFGLLAGISTGLMGLTWGGVTFAFITISLSAFVAFFTSDFRRKDTLAYGLWLFGFTLILFPFSRFGYGLFLSTTSGFAYLVFGLLIVHSLIFNTTLSKKISGIRLPKKLISLIAFVLIGMILLLIFEPSMIGHVFSDLNAQLIKPFEGDRLTVTVAENSRPFFNSWKGSFGMFFWIFFLGSILLFFEAVKSLELRQKIILTISYIILIFGIVFTRLKPDSILNGESAFSIFLFLGSMGLFAFVIIYQYFKRQEFNPDIGIVLILMTFFFSLISARGAIRLLYFLYPIAPIIAAFAIVRLAELTFEYKDEVMRIVLGLLLLGSSLISAYSLYQFSVQSYNEAKYGSVPSSYNIQWQLAMNWTRENTPKDSVFSHWWDYGYWVQTMGERATVLDGGNAITYWDYLMGRTLTANNETEMLEFLKTHKANYLLIDSSDIGKYPAFSSIGSDENYDRYSWISTFSADESNIIEKRNETIYVLKGGTMLDEDLAYKNQIFPKENSGIGAFMISVRKDNDSMAFNQPKAVLMNSGKQTEANVKCIYFNNQKMQFNEGGIDGCLYLMPRVTQTGILPIGGALWLSPRLMRSEFSKLYLFNESENFELAHIEQNIIINDLNSRYKLSLPEFVIYGGEVLGPIKIWKINYPSDIKENPKYLELTYPNPELSRVRK